MWRVRFFCLLSPAAIVAGVVWLWGELGKLSIETPTALVVAVREDPGALNPLQPSSGFQREITDLVFEKLFRRDDEMLMRGHLAERWELRQRVSFYFRDAAGVTAALAKLEELREARDERWLRWGVRSLEQKGDALELILGNHALEGVEEIDSLFDEATRFAVTRIQLTVRDAAKESFDLFRRDAVEKGQIRHVVFDEANQTGVISAAGEVDLFQRELELFYQANENLQPSLEVLGVARFVVEPEVRLHLREGVTWHDGTPFSADDVVYSYREVARPGSVSAMKPWFAPVIAVEAIEPRVVSVMLREPYAPLMESWEALPILPAHLLSGAAVAGEAQRAAFFDQPVGTGPYRVASREPGKSLTLRAFDGYFRGTPRQEEIRYEVIADHVARAIGFRLRQIDVLRPDDVERVVMRSDDRVEEIDGVPRTQSFVAWNLRREPFLDGRVRTALAHMIDVKALVEQAAGPESQVCRGIFYPNLWLCPEDVDVPGFDVEKAHAILAEAGWALAPDGDVDHGAKSQKSWLRNAQGEPLSFRLLVDAGNAEHRDVAAMLVDAWRSAGVKAEVETRPWLEMISGALQPRDFDAMLLSWELGFRRDQSELWHSSQTDAADGGGNFSGLRNQIIDDLLVQLKTETDPPAVQSLAVELQSLLWTLKPCLFLYESGEVMMARRGILREQRPLMDGRRSDQAVTAPPAGLVLSRPWWVKRELSDGPASNGNAAPVPPDRGGPQG